MANQESPHSMIVGVTAYVSHEAETKCFSSGMECVGIYHYYNQ